MITSFSPFSFFPRSVVGMISRACCAVACLAMRSDIKKISRGRANEERRSLARIIVHIIARSAAATNSFRDFLST